MSTLNTALRGASPASVQPMGIRIYHGKRTATGATVTVDGNLLNPRFDIWPFDLSGFEWGRGGAGSIQLSLAILADYLGDEKRAVSVCEAFSWEVVAKLSRPEWELSSTEIETALSRLRMHMVQ